MDRPTSGGFAIVASDVPGRGSRATYAWDWLTIKYKP